MRWSRGIKLTIKKANVKRTHILSSPNVELLVELVDEKGEVLRSLSERTVDLALREGNTLTFVDVFTFELRD